MPTLPATIAQFKAQFDRDFTFGVGKETVRDQDIANAQLAAFAAWNDSIWDTTSGESALAFNMATAHFVYAMVQAAGGLSAQPQGQGVNAANGGMVSQKAVGRVSLSYVDPPDIVKNNPVLAQFWSSKYGQQYLQLVQAKGGMVGNVGVAMGPVDPDVAIPNVPFLS